jgi:transcriptional regulator with XRE-family HTH domain
MNQSKSLGDAKLRKRRATAEDVAIGQKLRALRLARGLSQGELGDTIGVTFQQVQKYEIGANRISASRLALIAKALGVPVTAFFRAFAGREREQAFTWLRSKGALRLARAYAGAAEPRAKAALVTLAETLSGEKHS